MQTSHPALTANLHEWTVDCPGAPSAGWTVLMGGISDAMGYQASVYTPFDVVAP